MHVGITMLSFFRSFPCAEYGDDLVNTLSFNQMSHGGKKTHLSFQKFSPVPKSCLFNDYVFLIEHLLEV